MRQVKLINLIVRDPLGKSDHSVIEFQIKMEGEIVSSKTSVLCLNKGDYNGMRKELAKLDGNTSCMVEQLRNSGRPLKKFSQCSKKSIFRLKIRIARLGRANPG